MFVGVVASSSPILVLEATEQREQSTLIQYETVWMRTVLLLARASMLDGTAALVPSDPACGTNVPQVDALQRHVLGHLKRILGGLRRDLDEADAVTSDAGRATLQQVAVGKAACGLDILEQDGQLDAAFVGRPRVPALQFTTACRALTQVLDDVRGDRTRVPNSRPLEGACRRCGLGPTDKSAANIGPAGVTPGEDVA